MKVLRNSPECLCGAGVLARVPENYAPVGPT
jgi:hypothetical protein